MTKKQCADTALPNSTYNILRVLRLSPLAVVPAYQSCGAACFDLHAAIDLPVSVAARGTATVTTGLAFEVPAGFVMLVYSRSGHGIKNDIRLSNCVGVIDSDYRGAVLVKLTSDARHGSFEVRQGDRIAQAMIVPVQRWSIAEATSLSDTARATGGFGSTGR